MSKQKITINAKTAKRANASVTNIFMALAACTALLVPIIFSNMQNQKPHMPTVDILEISQQAQNNSTTLLAVPTLDSSWYSNYGRWKNSTTDNVPTWEAGFITPNNKHIALLQTANPNDTWIANVSNNATPTGDRNIDGHIWQIRDKGNEQKSLIFTNNESTIILKSEATFQEIDVLASAVTNHLCKQNFLCP